MTTFTDQDSVPSADLEPAPMTSTAEVTIPEKPKCYPVPEQVE